MFFFVLNPQNHETTVFLVVFCPQLRKLSKTSCFFSPSSENTPKHSKTIVFFCPQLRKHCKTNGFYAPSSDNTVKPIVFVCPQPRKHNKLVKKQRVLFSHKNITSQQHSISSGCFCPQLRKHCKTNAFFVLSSEN